MVAYERLAGLARAQLSAAGPVAARQVAAPEALGASEASAVRQLEVPGVVACPAVDGVAGR
jgi:hypothetical protein